MREHLICTHVLNQKKKMSNEDEALKELRRHVAESEDRKGHTSEVIYRIQAEDNLRRHQTQLDELTNLQDSIVKGFAAEEEKGPDLSIEMLHQKVDDLTNLIKLIGSAVIKKGKDKDGH